RGRTRLALDAERDRALALALRVEPRGGTLILHAVDDVAEIGQPNRRAVPVRDDHVPVFARVHQLTGGLQRERLVGADDAAGRRVHVPRAQRVLDFVDPDLPRGELVRIEL